jgi:hypothetical protein
MKYWLFDGSDIIGPFSLQELAGKRGFSSSSLVCPDGFSDQADHWQLASTFAELQPVLNGEPLPEEKPQTPADAPVEVDETPTGSDVSLRLPLTPGKAGPIEEYFNTIKGEDLGNILGIPDPNENTDADLARVIENELVNLPDKEVYEPFHQPVADTTAQPAPQPVKQTPAPKAQEVDTKPASAPQQDPAKQAQTAPKNAQAPAQKAPAPKPAQGAKKQNTGTAKPAAQPVKQAGTKQASKSAASQSARPNGSTNKPAAAQPAPAKKQPPVKNKPAATQVQTTSQTITKGEVEIEKFDTGRQEVDFSDYSDQIDSNACGAARQEEPTPAKPARSQWLMAILACLLLFVLVNLLVKDKDYTGEIIYSAKNFVQDIWPARFTGSATAALAETQAPAAPQEQPLRSVAETLTPLPAVALLPAQNEEADLRSPYAEPENDESTDLTITEGVPLTPAQTALLAVQNYQLPNGRGNIKDYLQNYYAPQFDKGYEADWSVALLHKNIYIVQYRLTKTRTEPIVYVFQADGEKGLLTGALNNITLDLVGKIQQ